MKKIYLDSVSKFNKIYGLPTKHPLVAAIDMRDATNFANHVELKGEIYSLFLKNAPNCRLRYGRKTFDFEAGTVVSISPGQTVTTDLAPEDISTDAIGIIFHPDLFFGTSLSEAIKRFSFFNYSELESLHLSDKEREKFEFYYNIIKEEIEQPIDSHSAAVISTNIQLLLEHLQRFYDRQFTTRHKENSDIVSQFENNLKQYFSEEYPDTIPSVSYFAEKAKLSPSYFSDLIRKETGTNPKDFISIFMIEEAKRKLVETGDDISEIAYKLGFEYPAHFTRMFKRLVGITPKEYRLSNNLN
ncbi:MAG: AraC family transcriptional regulator [Muribaculaceae bacterium]|nr:AraC family transcriptional regulator [Muribaculaceae bacterium]